MGRKKIHVQIQHQSKWDLRSTYEDGRNTALKLYENQYVYLINGYHKTTPGKK